ncbi:unnamed protein product [Lupinus luteus]|uniref:Uncharacterized protein n=1 Tax=Lupinus luteus TaxID=3873 RepID=A0AAV1W782_LUPLU
MDGDHLSHLVFPVVSQADQNAPLNQQTQSTSYQPQPHAPSPPSFHHLLHQQQHQLFWTYQRQEIQHINDFNDTGVVAGGGEACCGPCLCAAAFAGVAVGVAECG